MKNKYMKLLSLMLSCVLAMSIGFGPVYADGTSGTEDAKTTTSEVADVEQVTNIIDILTINDFHGNVEEKGKNLGIAKMVGYVNQEKLTNPNTLTVSAGDNYQGSALSNLTYGAPVTEMFKAMDLVASAVGNHEFDWGVDKIAEWSEKGGFPYLAANIYDKTTGEPVSWAKPYTVREIRGVKIAFIGLSTIQTAYQTTLENVKDLEFKTPAEGAQIWVDYLQAGNDDVGVPDIIIALTHVPSIQDRESKEVSGEEMDELTKVDGIDAVISGHSHQTVAGKMNGIPVVQAYKYGRSVGKLSIEINDDNTIAGITPSVEAVFKVSDNIIPNEETAVNLEKMIKDLEPIAGEVAGNLEEVLTHDRSGIGVTPLGYWVCDLMRKHTGVQIGLTNGGGLRRGLEAGDVTMGDLYEVMPFDNTLVKMTVTGEHLRQLIDHGIEPDFMVGGQFAGLKVVYDPAKEYGNRITSIMLEDGSDVEMDKLYTLVTNNFIVSGGDKYSFTDATNITDTYVPIRDLMRDSLKSVDVTNVPDVNVIKTVPKTTYIIQIGDVLWRIAKKYDMTYETLATYNELENPHRIYAGDSLHIPYK